MNITSFSDNLFYVPKHLTYNITLAAMQLLKKMYKQVMKTLQSIGPGIASTLNSSKKYADKCANR